MTFTPPLSAWPAFDADKPHPFFVGAAHVFNAWCGFGVPVPFAIAMVTMADMEAAFKAAVVGDHGSAYGIYQEHKDRAERIKIKIGVDMLASPAPSLFDQCRAAWWELNNTETRAREMILAANNAGDASRAATTYFERAGAGSAADRRAAEGERWSAWIGQHLDWVQAQG